MKKELTVIITFLNENIEVRNTVKSLRESTVQEFDIILINDSSTDGYDYKQVAKDFDTHYIEHTERKGVAASRDEGICMSRTKYFLLLDAHMRVYQSDWVDILVNELRKDDKSLLCTSTLDLDTEGNVKSYDANMGWGAYFDFSFLNIFWINKKNINKAIVTEVPCILGAAYACSKTYWTYLDGLSGLNSYGFDEQLISIKVWLDGGRCRVIQNVVFGHIFRESHSVPYENKPIDFFYNLLFIVELFFTFEMKVKLLQNFRSNREYSFVLGTIEKLTRNKDYILERRKYYQSIFPKKIDSLIDFNQKFVNRINSKTTN